MYKDISKMRPIELGSYVGDVALELKKTYPKLSKADLIELALKEIRESQEGEEN
ncbi:hypothetical protein QEW_4555 [Clostridioides difficile CD160]|nr:hypothetical protein QEW_4555 [Clostridioides difficile CD160]